MRAVPSRLPGPVPVRPAVRLGLAGAVLTLLAFAALSALTVRPFFPGDETSHANYALEVAHGHLPEFADRYAPRIDGMNGKVTTTAVHPPLYYLLVAAPLRLGVATGHGTGGLYLTRLLTALMGAGAVLAVAWFAWVLVPGRPEVAVGTAALLASVTAFQQLSSFVYNDALAMLTGTAALAAAVLVVRDGVGGRRLGLLVATAALAAATRASGLEIAAVCAAAGAAAVWLRAEGAGRARARAAAGPALLVGGVVAVTSGWFYVRNVLLLGDLAGQHRAVLGGHEGPSVLANLLSPAFWLDQYDQQWGQMTASTPIHGLARLAAHFVLVVVALGAVAALARLRPRRLSAGARVVAVLLGGHGALTALMFLQYVHTGAIPFVRYLYAALPVVLVGVALALAALPGGRRGLPLVAVVAVADGIGVAMTGLVLAATSPGVGGPGAFGRMLGTLRAAHVVAPEVLLAVLAAAALGGLLLLGAGLWRLGGREEPDLPEPLDAPARRPGRVTDAARASA